MASPAWKAKERGANPTEAPSRLSDVTDRMHALLVARADELMGCTENSAEQAELAALTDVIESYDRQRGPLGKIPGGKG